MEDQLSSIWARLSDLESAPRFEVVDKAGNVMFGVGKGSVRLYSPGRKIRIAIYGNGGGGMFAATDGNSLLTVRADDVETGMTIDDKDHTRMFLGKDTANNYTLKFPVGKSEASAGIGESVAGSGALIVGDQEGELKAEAGLFRGDGAFIVYNGDGNGVAVLTKSVNGGGALDLTDSTGVAQVLMKTNENRYGIVSAFPPGLPYIPSSGLPGTYLLGCAGGNKCLPYK